MIVDLCRVSPGMKEKHGIQLNLKHSRKIAETVKRLALRREQRTDFLKEISAFCDCQCILNAQILIKYNS